MALAEALGLDLRQGKVRCAEHGEGHPAAFVCQQLAASTRTGQPAGFHCADDPDAARPDAWCSACDEAVTANDGEWTVETEAAAGITLICGACYDRIKTLSIAPVTRWTLRNFFGVHTRNRVAAGSYLLRSQRRRWQTAKIE